MIQKLVSAKAFKRRRDLKDKSILVLPASCKEDSRNEYLCLKKRGRLLKQSVPRGIWTIRNLELYNDGVEVSIEDPVNES